MVWPIKLGDQVLSELHIEGLGVISSATILFEQGLVAITGETGAGKTMIVEAIDLLLGERFDASMLRAGSDEARVDGRFECDGKEIVLSRVMPRDGRSRAYVDGRLATAAQLADIGAGLVDLHAQNAQHSIIRTGAQRSAVDQFGKVDLGPLREIRARLTEIEASLAALGGDARTRARDIDLLRFQIAEIMAAGIVDHAEEVHLEAEEDLLAKAVQYRESFQTAYGHLTDDNGALDRIQSAIAALGSGAATERLAARLRDLVALTDDLVADLRQEVESVEENPERLAEVRARRQMLRELRRKYGDSLADVLSYFEEASIRLDELVGHDGRVAELEGDRAALMAQLEDEQAKVLSARRKAAPKLASAINKLLPGLALTNARVEIEVGGAAGDEVEIRFSANPGMPLQPIAKVASGGETSRLMLAINLVLTAAPDTLVFDEVDAGIGGDTANTVADALASLGESRQVLVVTHLPQVAAAARQQVHVSKRVESKMTIAEARTLNQEERVAEIARMLSGDASGKTALAHAREIMSDSNSRRKGSVR